MMTGGKAPHSNPLGPSKTIKRLGVCLFLGGLNPGTPGPLGFLLSIGCFLNPSKTQESCR